MQIEIKIKQFIFKFLIFCILLTLIAAILYLTIYKKFYIKLFPLQLLLIGTLTAISHIRLIKACEQNIRRFTTVYIFTVTIKLLSYLSFLIICLLIDHSNALVFVLTFFILYLCFTVFEVSQVLKFLHK
jgi:hypothetical protein